jgi:hypothetical protein
MEVHDQERRRDGADQGTAVMALDDMVDGIETRDDLAAFVAVLRRDLVERPDGWENASLDRFLEAAAAWLDDADGFFLNRGEPVPTAPTWRFLGQLLLAAKHYE